MTIALVTGASGFLGRYVKRELTKRGVEAVGLCRSPGSADERSIMLPGLPTRYDLRSILDRVRPSLIFHLAGQTHSDRPEDIYQSNVILAAHLLEAALSVDRPPTVVLAGSAAEYGRPTHTDCIVREADPCMPLSLYGISKLTQTHHGLAAHARGLPVIMARLFNPIGAGAPRSTALGSFVSQLAATSPSERTLRTGPLNAVRDFCDAADAARALIDLAEAPHAVGQIINVCTGVGTTVQHLVDRLMDIADAPITHEIDVERRGTSDLDVIIGDASRLSQLGIAVPLPDLNAILRQMLAAARTENGRVAL
ncbi:NAD-dependent epimerase/dehydratase family protein [Bradyrhizobium brasilense]|uniref:NAD-dependent epimerase/dehydratase family protein n=1 Tax=Bradyrhizobium brasilense TaxID=1419277 RepID=UPI002877DB83|nr:NAD-dependent epimerase/dehydratase family protein [Bradyrhizobium brasilense]MCP3417914.1 NAD-dependent epimerase/dehydratase family protein [Bradyrhizobium brasilense]